MKQQQIIFKLNDLFLKGNNSITCLVKEVENLQSQSKLSRKQKTDLRTKKHTLKTKINEYIEIVIAAINLNSLASDPFGITTGVAFSSNSFASKCVEEHLNKLRNEDSELFTAVDAAAIKQAHAGSSVKSGTFKNGVRWTLDAVTGALVLVSGKVSRTIAYIKGKIDDFYTYIKEVFDKLLHKNAEPSVA